ncbi:hypothetical protein ACFL5V_04070 [Fibrobacterota bacterium]
MTDPELQNYTRLFSEIINSFEEFTASREYKLLGSEDLRAPEVVVKSLGRFVARKLKEESHPENVLKYIEVIDKIYFRCLMKNEVFSSIFELLYREDNNMLPKFNRNLPEDLKKELKQWLEKHGGEFFGEGEPGGS